MHKDVAEDKSLERSRPPEGATAKGGEHALVAISSIGVIPFTFEFKVKPVTGTPAPGAVHEDTRVVTIPTGAGFFITLNYIDGGFRENDLNTLRERPIGQFFISVGMRGNNLVCQVRMTDANSDDPITVRASGAVVTFK